MKCPHCKAQELVSYKLNGIEIHVCHTCNGFWLAKKELEGIKDKIPDDAWFDLDLWNDNEKLLAKPSDQICPVCNVSMHSLDWDDSNIIISICKKCNGIWLEHGQMKKVIQYIKDEADLDLLNKYGATLEQQLKEVFTGPKSLPHELHDVWTVLNMFQYKIMAQNPNVTAALMAANELAVDVPGI